MRQKYGIRHPGPSLDGTRTTVAQEMFGGMSAEWKNVRSQVHARRPAFFSISGELRTSVLPATGANLPPPKPRMPRLILQVGGRSARSLRVLSRIPPAGLRPQAGSRGSTHTLATSA